VKGTWGRALLGTGALALSLAAVTRPAPPPSQEAMVQRTCAICHLLPPPEILPKSAWKRVVRDMTGLIVEGTGMPASSAASALDFDFEQIADYYERRAPSELPSPVPWPAPGADPARFVRHRLDFAGAKGPAAVANVQLLSLTAGAPPEVVAVDMLAGLVLVGAGKPGSSGLREVGHLASPCHVSAVDLDRDGRTDLLVADLGNPVPGDTKQGSVTWMRSRPDGTYQAIPLATGLPRVADVEAGDFDGDGDLDLVVAAFGWRKVGAILLLENQTKDWSKPVFETHVVDTRTGAIHVPVTDLDGDGRLDFVALVAQQHETVSAFLGDGKGNFREETIDRAPHPAWGSSGIQLVDLDGDKDLDVLVTNGDMLDDFQMKPYHGIRWLENRGRFPFVPHDVAPFFGALRAQAADLDGDGDMDIVACSLVQLARTQGGPAPSRDLPSLVWLEQTAPGRFERHTLETGGRHLSLDLGDADGDGDVDIVVANSLSGTPGFVEVWENRVRR
jgi:FG-GAP-like repeat